MDNRTNETISGPRRRRETRNEIISEVKKHLPRLTDSLSERERAAYLIAGLMGTALARSLQDGDPLIEVLAFAGELEVPGTTAEADWQELARLIDSL